MLDDAFSPHKDSHLNTIAEKREEIGIRVNIKNKM